MAKTLAKYTALLLAIFFVFYMYDRMLGAVPLLILSIVLYYMAYLEIKRERRKTSNDLFEKDEKK